MNDVRYDDDTNHLRWWHASFLVCVHSAQDHNIITLLLRYKLFFLKNTISRLSIQRKVYESNVCSDGLVCFLTNATTLLTFTIYIEKKNVHATNKTAKITHYHHTTINFYYGSTTHKYRMTTYFTFLVLLVVSLNCTYGSTGLVVIWSSHFLCVCNAKCTLYT